MPDDSLELERKLFRVDVEIGDLLAGFVVYAANSEQALGELTSPIQREFPNYPFDPTSVMHEVFPLSGPDKKKAETYQKSWRDGQLSALVSCKRFPLAFL
jgi:hypothetical protein